jgi:hypothetical protein
MGDEFFELWSVPNGNEAGPDRARALVVKVRFKTLPEAIEAAERDVHATFIVDQDGAVAWMNKNAV